MRVMLQRRLGGCGAPDLGDAGPPYVSNLLDLQSESESAVVQDMKTLPVGTRVVCIAEALRDEDEQGRTYTHAFRAESGTVLAHYADAAGPTVLWDRSQTVSDVSPHEYAMVALPMCA